MMPQASDEMRNRWREPDGTVGEQRPQKYLHSCGYTLTHDWQWVLPMNRLWPTDTEYDAMKYMVHEWDFGGWLMHPETYRHKFNWSA